MFNAPLDKNALKLAEIQVFERCLKYGTSPDYNDAVEEIKENIEYDCFLSDRDKPLIDEIVKIMAEVLTMNTPYYRSSGQRT